MNKGQPCAVLRPRASVILYGAFAWKGKIGGHERYNGLVTQSPLLGEVFEMIALPRYTFKFNGLMKLAAYPLSFTVGAFVDVIRLARLAKAGENRALHVAAMYRWHIIKECLLVYAARKMGMKVLYDIRAGDFICWLDRATWLMRRCAGYILKNSSEVSVEGASYIPEIRGRYGVAAHYIPNFVDTVHERRLKAVSVSNPGEPLKVYYSGRVVREKGVEEILDAIELLLPGGIKVFLEISGSVDPAYLARLQRRYSKLFSDGTVVYKGILSKEELMERMQSAEVFVLPSKHFGEGHSNALNEAMLAGLAPVVSRQGFLADIIGSDCGIVLNEPSAQEAASALKALYEDRARLFSMRARARAKVLSEYSDTVVLPKLKDIYKSMFGFSPAGVQGAPKERIKIAFAGDMNFSGSVAKRFAEQTMPIDKKIIDVFKTCDLVIANLEVPLSDRGEAVPFKHRTLSAGSGAAGAVAAQGINVCLLANNHITDFGPDALKDTVNVLRSCGIHTVGAGMNEKEACAPLILNVKGVKAAILNYTDIREVWASAETAGAAPFNITRACQTLKELKKNADVMIVSIHGGVEFSKAPSPFFISQCRTLIDEGACCVIGHHPHVLQGIESSEKGIIAYSIGTFVFDSSYFETEEDACRRSCILTVELGACRCKPSYCVYPLILDQDGIPHLVEDQAQKDEALSQLRQLSMLLSDTRELKLLQKKAVLDNIRRQFRVIINDFREKGFRSLYYNLKKRRFGLNPLIKITINILGISKGR